MKKFLIIFSISVKSGKTFFGAKQIYQPHMDLNKDN